MKRTNPQDKVICVDLDGTLIRTDLLWESALLTFKHSPLAAISALTRLWQGRAVFKNVIAVHGGTSISVENLPYDEDVLDYLRAQKASGSRIELVSAADQTLVDRVARHLDIFEEGFGSDGTANLKGEAKAAFLRERHPGGFTYLGNSHADLAPWLAAEDALSANAPKSLLRKVRSMGRPITEISERASVFRAMLKAMRLHQWVKNSLLFTMLLLTLPERTAIDFLNLCIGFVAFGMVASATYLFNDLLDIEADRTHGSKRRRPFASGDLPIHLGGLLMCGLLVSGFGLGLLLPWLFVLILAIYTVLTVSYTLFLKSVPVLDVLTLALLYCVRILAGGAIIEEAIVSWLAVFSLLFFASLAFAKRHNELGNGGASEGETLAGRGYRDEDLSFVSSFGVALAVGSLLVFLLYAFSGQSQALSSTPIAMVCFGVISYWIMRIWLLTMRGRLHDDPVLFAVKDPVSIALALVITAALIADQWLR